jgi:REP element-mobilizing transposase RayT
MSLPRPVYTGTTYMITRRCSERRLFLQPSPRVFQIFAFLMAVAAERTGVLLHAVCVLGNHVLCAAAHKTCYAQRLVMRS